MLHDIMLIESMLLNLAKRMWQDDSETYQRFHKVRQVILKTKQVPGVRS